MKKTQFLAVIFLFSLLMANLSVAQDIYSARGYWIELNKETYKKIQEKQAKGESLSENESSYLKDYEVYLNTYYQRMSDAEKVKYDQMKSQWDAELAVPAAPVVATQDDFELRGRDRFVNGVYGLYYGLAIDVVAEIDGAAAAGIPLIMAGLWQLGPVINKKKYENLALSTIRAGNSGKFLGAVYGGALGLALGGSTDSEGKYAIGFSAIGSIALGEIAFQRQKRNPVSEGHIELMRHYGFLGPIVALSGLAVTNNDNLNVVGLTALAGGIGGLLIGNGQAKKYDYTSGDVDAISSLTLISTGLGLALASEAFDSDNLNGLFIIPAASAIAGTIFGQRSVKGAHLTKRQGSTISLSSGGGALIGLGVVLLTESDSPGVIIGVPSVLALVVHQLVFHSYKRKNMESSLNLGAMGRKNSVSFSLKATPENYYVNKKLDPEKINFNSDLPELAKPIVKLRLTF